VAEERPSSHLKPLLFNDLKFHLHYDIIYYGVVAQDSMTEDSA